MSARSSDRFPTVRSEGAILPVDLLQRIAANNGELDGRTPASYHLIEGEKLNEATNRAWNRLLGVWNSFQRAAEKLPPTNLGASITLERWLLPLWQELGYGRLLPTAPTELDGKIYPISHIWLHTPIHLVGCRSELDRRVTCQDGTSLPSPHSLVQEFLNRSENHLWGFVTNGLRLRILRNNSRLTRQAYVEFDIQAMFEGKVYTDFALMWRLCHQSRVEAAKPHDCWLEQWSKVAQQQGLRILDQLRDGVERAIAALGRGFLSYPANHALREELRAGRLDAQDYYRQLLRLVYRLLFLFVAEDRDLLLDAEAEADSRDRYTRFYSTARLRQQAERLRGTQHADLYETLHLIMARLGSAGGCPDLGLPALGGFLFSPEAISHLKDCRLANADLLEAIRALALTSDGNALRPVDYRNLGAEEFGSVYESLLELHPVLNAEAGTFELKTASGHERKTTGSYYTPTSLITCLLDSALDPVLNEAARKPDPERAIRDLKVCDPACGSGHFLIAAAHRIAKRLAAARTGEEEPPPQAQHKALRDVIGHCIYGVDINPMAVELCKVALWMEALEPGKPLSFLDHHIQCGNSLLGTTPALLAKGIPDEAFQPIEGDVKARCTELKKQNKRERSDYEQGQIYLFEPFSMLGNLPAEFSRLNAAPDDSIAAVTAIQDRYAQLVHGTSYENARLWADTWCAAFVWKKDGTELGGPCPTERDFRNVERHAQAGLTPHVRAEVERLRDQYHFFHWHLAFPDVFRVPGKEEDSDNEQTGWCGGFNVMLGNPPWDRLKHDETEWFAGRDSEIAQAPTTAARTRLLDDLPNRNPRLAQEFGESRRAFEGINAYLRSSGRYEHGAGGELNLAILFAETASLLVNLHGRVGMILPTTIVTDKSAQPLCQHWVQAGRLASVFDFENRDALFPDVHRSYKFCLLTLLGSAGRAAHTEAIFFATSPQATQDAGQRLKLTFQDIRRINPNTTSFPVVRSRKDWDLLQAIYEHGEPLVLDSAPESGSWGYGVLFLFEMNRASHLFQETPSEEAIPLLEAKLIHQFDHRAATFDRQSERDRKAGNARESYPEELARAEFSATPRFWLPKQAVEAAYERGDLGAEWAIVIREITNSTNERTIISCLIPRVGMGHTCWTVRLSKADPIDAAMFVANLNSFALDYAARQKVGGTHMSNFILKQLPVLARPKYHHPCAWAAQGGTLASWMMPRILELSYPAGDMEAFARDCGYDGPPFRWNSERRFLIRCELDAAFFHLYGIARDDVAYIMDTFPIVRRHDEQQHGTYHTKTAILEIYDALADAIRTGRSYHTRLNPPPGPPQAGLPNWQVGQLMPADWPLHIHPPKEIVVPATKPLPIPLRPAAIAPLAFPATPRERWLVAAFLDMLTTQPGLRREEYQDALKLATSQDACTRLLTDAKDKRALKRCLKQVSPNIVGQRLTTVPWDSIWRFVQMHRIVEIENDAVTIGDDASLKALQANMGPGSSTYITLVMKAALRLRERTSGDREAATVLEEMRQS